MNAGGVDKACKSNEPCCMIDGMSSNTSEILITALVSGERGSNAWVCTKKPGIARRKAD
jgi:hypothetical protein